MRPGPPHPDHRGHRVNGMARSEYHSQVPHRRRLSASVAQDQIFPHLVCAPSDLLGDVAQTYLLGAQTPHQRSLFDIEMGGQWISSGWTLHQWSLIERCAHPRHPRIRMGAIELFGTMRLPGLGGAPMIDAPPSPGMCILGAIQERASPLWESASRLSATKSSTGLYPSPSWKIWSGPRESRPTLALPLGRAWTRLDR